MLSVNAIQVRYLLSHGGTILLAPLPGFSLAWFPFVNLFPPRITVVTFVQTVIAQGPSLQKYANHVTPLKIPQLLAWHSAYRSRHIYHRMKVYGKQIAIYRFPWMCTILSIHVHHVSFDCAVHPTLALLLYNSNYTHIMS